MTKIDTLYCKLQANDGGQYFPLWGTCQGFELLTALTAGENLLVTAPLWDTAVPLNFSKGQSQKLTHTNGLTVTVKSVYKGVRTFVPTDIRSHAIFDRAGHSCSHQMTTPDIRAHIK